MQRGAFDTNLVRVAALAAGLALATGCDRTEEVDLRGEAAADAAPTVVPVPVATTPRDRATIEVAGFGPIEIELLPDLAPGTVANFLKLAEEGFYDGTTFHRVVPGFMIQGGDPNTKNRDPRDDGMGGADWVIPDEFSDVSHVRGTVAMANASRPDTASSQFFIVVADSLHLDGSYTLFGHVTSGMEVVDRIVAVERDEYGRHGPKNRPVENVVMERVTLARAPGAEDAAQSAADRSAAIRGERPAEWEEGAP